MQSYRVTPAAGEAGSKGRRLFSSYLQTPTKFIGEIHTVLSSVLIITFAIVITVFSLLEESENGDITNYRLGVIIFLIVALVASCLDLGLAIFLIHAAKEMSRTKSLFWWRCTCVSTILSCLLSVCFVVLIGTGLILLAILPNLAFKPFALYVVGGFLGDIARSRAKMKGPPLQTLSMDNPEDSVDSAGPSRRRPPTSASSDSSQGPRGRSVLVYPEPDNGNKEHVASGGDTPATTASVVEEILQEKFNFLSKPTHAKNSG